LAKHLPPKCFNDFRLPLGERAIVGSDRPRRANYAAVFPVLPLKPKRSRSCTDANYGEIRDWMVARCAAFGPCRDLRGEPRSVWTVIPRRFFVGVVPSRDAHVRAGAGERAWGPSVWHQTPWALASVEKTAWRIRPASGLGVSARAGGTAFFCGQPCWPPLGLSIIRLCRPTSWLQSQINEANHEGSR